MSYATYTSTETVAMHADTARELRAPITGSGPLAARFASEGHGLTVRNLRTELDNATREYCTAYMCVINIDVWLATPEQKAQAPEQMRATERALGNIVAECMEHGISIY